MRTAGLVCSLAIGLGSVMMAAPAARANVAVGVAIRIGPPPLPVYAQPVCPGPGYLWTPGYWAYGDVGYYWVPGTWVLPPEAGLLWTPGYWAFNDGVYLWNAGYWGPTVGFYGGIDYGFGYPGVGFFGGYWRGRTFYYNRAVTHVDVHVVRNVYDHHVEHPRGGFDRVSFNGGVRGVHARPTAREAAAMREHHFQMTAAQNRQIEAARSDRALRASVNRGRPHVTATQRPGEFHGSHAVEYPHAIQRARIERTHQQTALRHQKEMSQAQVGENAARQRAENRNLQAREQRYQRNAEARQQASSQRARQQQARMMQRSYARTQQRYAQQRLAQQRPAQQRFAQRQPRQMQRRSPQRVARGERGGRPHGPR